MVKQKRRMGVLGSEVVDLWKEDRCWRGAVSWLASKRKECNLDILRYQAK